MLFIEKVFTSILDKITFIKGLVLIEIADGELAEQESDYIYHQAKILDIPYEIVDNLFVEMQQSDSNYELGKIQFNSKYKAINFLICAIRLGYQDGHYTQDEISSVEIIAKINGIDMTTLAKLETHAKFENLLIVERDKQASELAGN